MLIVIEDMLKAVKNMAQFLCSREVLDDEGYPIGRILCLSSEEVVPVKFLLIQTDPVPDNRQTGIVSSQWDNTSPVNDIQPPIF
eukprot:g38460.t1